MHSATDPEIDLHHSKLIISNNKLLYVYLVTDYFYTYKEALEIYEAMKQLTGGKKVKAILIAADGSDCDKETRSFISSKDITDMLKALALVSRSLAQDILGNFIITFDKPPQPTKLFRSIDKAIQWLNNV
ncbi:MAG: hypothetical protein JNJ40_01415 [Bacteroidia bacterium]|nr:hypothetical protein [Bacteroidia bacterium]